MGFKNLKEKKALSHLVRKQSSLMIKELEE